MNFLFESVWCPRRAEDHVRQLALSAFVADRAIERVIGQQIPAFTLRALRT